MADLQFEWDSAKARACERENGNVIRLISARRATRSERIQHDARWKR